MALLPIQVPFIVEHQRLERGQAISSWLAPMHTFMLLTTRNDQIASLLCMAAANVDALGTSFCVVDNVGLSCREIVDQFVQPIFIPALWAMGFQEINGLCHLSAPQTGDQTAHQGCLDLATMAEHTRQSIAFLNQVAPIQDQFLVSEGGQPFSEELANPSCPVTQQSDPTT